MARTDEQKAADEDLREALDRHAAAYEPEWTGLTSRVLTDFVTVAVQRGFMEDGSDGSRLIIGTPNSGDVPAYSLVGLLETAKAQILHEYVAVEE